jgi:hypothetical protein
MLHCHWHGLLARFALHLFMGLAVDRSVSDPIRFRSAPRLAPAELHACKLYWYGPSHLHSTVGGLPLDGTRLMRMPVRDTRRPCPRTGVCAVSCNALLFITVRGRWPVLACYTVDRPCVRSHSTCRCISTYLLRPDPCKQAWQVLN